MAKKIHVYSFRISSRWLPQPHFQNTSIMCFLGLGPHWIKLCSLLCNL